jgi:anti-sigma factor RsiW
MTCHDARESLSAFLDAALAPAERREVDAHL